MMLIIFILVCWGGGQCTENQVVTTICGDRAYSLEIIEGDTHIGYLGQAYVTCPCCEKEAAVDELDGITLTADNIEFPAHFYRTSANFGAAKISNQEIKRDIKQGIEYFRKNKDSHYWYTSYGELFLVMFRFSGNAEYWVVVTEDFYDTIIPFEDIDYDEEE